MPFKFKYNVEKDPFYIEGISQGISKENYEIIVRMLGLSFSHEQIAEIVNTKVAFVKEIAGKLS